MVIGILRIHDRRYGLELQKRLPGSPSDIYYRIHYCDVIASGVHQLQGKITVQVDANATRDHLGGVGVSVLVGRDA
jgi:hypothetical protein